MRLKKIFAPDRFVRLRLQSCVNNKIPKEDSEQTVLWGRIMNYAPKKKELLNGFEAFFKKHGLEGIEEINRARQTLIGVLEVLIKNDRRLIETLEEKLKLSLLQNRYKDQVQIAKLIDWLRRNDLNQEFAFKEIEGVEELHKNREAASF